MKRYKRITKEMIRRYFGSGAKIRGGFGSWRVTTATGGEAVITQTKITLITGSDDVYRACVLLSGEAWGGGTARPGSREFMLGMMAHGEAWNVPIRPDHTKRGAGAKRFLVAFMIVIAALKIGIAQTDEGMFLTLIFAGLVYLAMRQSAKRKARKEAEQMGYHYPRVQGTAGAASRDDLERKGWL
jgi:hypothetical protein